MFLIWIKALKLIAKLGFVILTLGFISSINASETLTSNKITKDGKPILPTLPMASLRADRKILLAPQKNKPLQSIHPKLLQPMDIKNPAVTKIKHTTRK